jgi:hypothetical protein
MSKPLPSIKTRVPGPHPVEEALHWSGAPHWRGTAVRIWRVPLAAFYFALLLADGTRAAFGHTPAAAAARQGDAALLIIGLLAVGLLSLLSWLTTKTTTYTVTDSHLILRYGIALKATLVIPFGAIDHVAVRVNRDHTGDVAVRLKGGRRVAYPKLWPHVRPWRWLSAEPMLRCVPQAGAVGALLARMVRAHAEVRSGLLGRLDTAAEPGHRAFRA